MVTLMTWGNSEGTKGRCDAKCHCATGPDCDCMCGGRFHGRGADLDKAVEEFWDEAAENAKQRAKEEGFDLDVIAFQRTLFGAISDAANALKHKSETMLTPSGGQGNNVSG